MHIHVLLVFGEDTSGISDGDGTCWHILQDDGAGAYQCVVADIDWT
jgi:hypothetical protein